MTEFDRFLRNFFGIEDSCDPDGPGDPTHAGLVLFSTPAGQCTHEPLAGACRITGEHWYWRNGPTFFWCDEHRETKCMGYLGKEPT